VHLTHSLLLRSCEAPGQQLGVECLAQGHFDMQLMGRAGIEPRTSWLQDDPSPRELQSTPKCMRLRIFFGKIKNSYFFIIHRYDTLVSIISPHFP